MFCCNCCKCMVSVLSGPFDVSWENFYSENNPHISCKKMWCFVSDFFGAFQIQSLAERFLRRNLTGLNWKKMVILVDMIKRLPIYFTTQIWLVEFLRAMNKKAKVVQQLSSFQKNKYILFLIIDYNIVNVLYKTTIANKKCESLGHEHKNKIF